MSDFAFNAQHKAAFETFGYLSFPGLLAGRAERIIESFEHIWAQRARGPGGKSHDRRQRSIMLPFIDQSEYLSSLLEDPAIDAICTGLMGADFNYLSSDGGYYVGDTTWHSDNWPDGTLEYRRSPLIIKIALYLDPLTRDTGALRVIPGSHLAGTGFADKINAELGESKRNWGMEHRDVPALALETVAGDVVVFNQNLKHASFGGGDARRMLTLCCSQRCPGEAVHILRTIIKNNVHYYSEHESPELSDKVFGPIMRNGPESRQIHLEQMIAEQDELPGLVATARREKAAPAHR